MVKLKLYAILCPRADTNFEDQSEQACLAGADAVILRAPGFTTRQILDAGERIKEVCRKHRALFIVNDRPDQALALDADGLLLGAGDIPVRWARAILGPRKQVGSAITSLGQALSAVQEGADYLVVGPIYRPYAAGGDEARGIDVVRMITKRVKVPVIAAGGITPERVAEVVDAGAGGIAVMRLLCEGSPGEGIAALKQVAAALP